MSDTSVMELVPVSATQAPKADAHGWRGFYCACGEYLLIDLGGMVICDDDHGKREGCGRVYLWPIGPVMEQR